MNLTIHKSETRGYANHGWLETRHTFSFASYYNPERMRFGVLRVLNDDIIKEGNGFGTHPHDNMEIITIPLSGAIKHSDSLGNTGIIESNEIQIMSAGSGIKHSEYNPSDTQQTSLLQIWIFPKEKNITPRYEQKKIDYSKSKNAFQLLVSGEKKSTETLSINQNAFLSIGIFDEAGKFEYKLNDETNGVYFFIIEGETKLNDIVFNRRDGIGIENEKTINFEVLKPGTRILTIEVPV